MLPILYCLKKRKETKKCCKPEIQCRSMYMIQGGREASGNKRIDQKMAKNETKSIVRV